MKDNIREALFNLVGAWVPGKIVIDLFAGTGAIGFEALSRGADRAILIERHVPTINLIRKNAASLGAEEQTKVVGSDTFFWYREFVSQGGLKSADPWMVFCSPPYDFFVERTDEMIDMITGIQSLMPPGSILVVESDSRFKTRLLPNYEQWRIKNYSPAVVGIYRDELIGDSDEQDI